MSYRGADVFLLAFSLISRASFENVSKKVSSFPAQSLECLLFWFSVMVFRFFFMSFSFGAVDPRVEALCPISAHYSCRDQTRCLSSLTLISLPALSIPSLLSKFLMIFMGWYKNTHPQMEKSFLTFHGHHQIKMCVSMSFNQRSTSHDIKKIVLCKTMPVHVSKTCIFHCSVISRGRLFLKLLLVPHPPLPLFLKSVLCIVWYCSDWKSYAVTWDGRSERRQTIPLGLSWGTYNIDETGQHLELFHFPFESCFRFC